MHFPPSSFSSSTSPVTWILRVKEDLRSLWLASSRGVLPSHAIRSTLSGQRREHGGPTPAHPALGRPIRYLQYLPYLRIGESLHVPQNQSRPVLRPHVRKQIGRASCRERA